MAEKGKKLEIDDRELREITTYEKREKENWPDGRIKWSHDSVFGLDVPERVFREVHIARLTRTLALALALTLTLTPALTPALTQALTRRRWHGARPISPRGRSRSNLATGR